MEEVKIVLLEPDLRLDPVERELVVLRCTNSNIQTEAARMYKSCNFTKRFADLSSVLFNGSHIYYCNGKC